MGDEIGPDALEAEAIMGWARVELVRLALLDGTMSDADFNAALDRVEARIHDADQLLIADMESRLPAGWAVFDTQTLLCPCGPYAVHRDGWSPPLKHSLLETCPNGCRPPLVLMGYRYPDEA